MAFREMRRKGQQLSDDEVKAVLLRNGHGVLALLGDDGYPYAVPLDYAYDPGRDAIVFHCAKAGHKLDAVARCDKASFCVVDKADRLPERFTTLFRSVIAFGHVRVVADDGERLAALKLIGESCAPGDEAGLSHEIRDGWDHVTVMELVIEHATGKEARELVAKRRHGQASTPAALT